MIDKDLVKKRFSSHFDSYNGHASVQKEVCSAIIEELISLNLPIKRALEVGAGTGLLTSGLLTIYPHGEWFINDLSSSAKPFLEEVALHHNIRPTFLFGDAETIQLPKEIDLVASASTIQWFDNVDSFVERLPMKKGGVVAFSTFLEGNFKEIVESSGHEGLQYLSESELIAIFEQKGYKIIHCSNFERRLYFQTPLDVLRHIRFTGVNGVGTVRWTRAQFDNFCAKYKDSFSLKNQVFLTYKPIVVIAQKK